MSSEVSTKRRHKSDFDRSFLSSAIFSHSLGVGGGVRSRGLPVGDAAADGWISPGGQMSDGGLQRPQEEPGSPVPEPGGGAALGARNPDAAGEGGQHDGEGEAGPISCLSTS